MPHGNPRILDSPAPPTAAAANLTAENGSLRCPLLPGPPGRAPSSRGLGHGPFKAATRVRIPSGSPLLSAIRSETCKGYYAACGECATGYVPIESAWKEKDGNLDPWCWVAPGAEKVLTDVLRVALAGK